TLLAVSGPWFVAVTVNVMTPFGATGFGVAVPPIDRSADAPPPPPPSLTGVDVCAESFVPSGSTVLPEASAMPAVLTRGPVAPTSTFTLTAIVALAPGLSRPRSHVRRPPTGAPHEPWLGVALPNVTEPDSGSVSSTRAADTEAVPLFVAVMRYDSVP